LRKKTAERASRKAKDQTSTDKSKFRHASTRPDFEKYVHDRYLSPTVTHSGSPGLGETHSQFHATYYKFFVGGGNNFPLVRSVLKYRWWL